MATKKTNKKDPLKSKNEWTITEFQMWLHGAYSLQGEDWVPTADQWEMIVDIIYKLKDRKVAAAPRQPVMPVMQPMSQPMMGPGPMMQQDSVLGGGGDGANPAFDPDANLPPEASMSRAQLEAASKNGTLNSGQKAIKTANIDTSKGYNSGFE